MKRYVLTDEQAGISYLVSKIADRKRRVNDALALTLQKLDATEMADHLRPGLDVDVVEVGVGKSLNRGNIPIEGAQGAIGSVNFVLTRYNDMRRPGSIGCWSAGDRENLRLNAKTAWVYANNLEERARIAFETGGSIPGDVFLPNEIALYGIPIDVPTGEGYKQLMFRLVETTPAPATAQKAMEGSVSN